MSEFRRHTSTMDVVIGSVHAVTEDGRAVAASYSGSQLAPYVFGADRVIWVVGAQKVVPDLETALDRIEKHSLPLESERLQGAYGIASWSTYGPFGPYPRPNPLGSVFFVGSQSVLLGSSSIQTLQDELSAHPVYILLPVVGGLVIAMILASLIKGRIGWLLVPVAIVGGLIGGHALVQQIDPTAPPGPGPIVFHVNVPNPSIGG